MARWNVLVVEDDLTYQKALSRYLDGRFNVFMASTVREATRLSKNQSFDLGLIDLHLPDGNGFDLMKQFRRLQPTMTMIVITGQGTVETAVKAIQRGAFHYLLKPFQMDRLGQLILEAQKQKKLAEGSAVELHVLKQKFHFEDIIGQSPAILEVFKLVEKVSVSDSTILIRGESGTGKELIAKAIHVNGARRDKPFITVNCGALQEQLLESELFGHVKGAFTGAVQSRKGRFEVAHKGTIFLDEVGDMSPGLQVKLLRVLQKQQFEPVGTSRSIKVDVRIIAATHQDLEQAVIEKIFREDLYYRLNVIPIFMPPLRNRTGDISILVEHFLAKYQRGALQGKTYVSEEAIKVLQRYPWPGNIRELENLVERLVILQGAGEIRSRDLPEKYFLGRFTGRPDKHVLPIDGIDLNTVIRGMEENYIQQALQRTGGNRNKAARLLRLKRTTLVEKLKRKKITPPDV